MIYNSAGQLMDAYRMKFDSDGNEEEFAKYDANGNILGTEQFSIAKKNDEGQWTERWGYKNGLPNSFHRRTFSD